MKDVDKLPWIKRVLEKVSAISRETRGKRKLLARLRELIDVKNSAASRIQSGGEVENHPPSNELPVLPKTAVMLRRPSLTPFASHESVLEIYL